MKIIRYLSEDLEFWREKRTYFINFAWLKRSQLSNLFEKAMQAEKLKKMALIIKEFFPSGSEVNAINQINSLHVWTIEWETAVPSNISMTFLEFLKQFTSR